MLNLITFSVAHGRTVFPTSERPRRECYIRWWDGSGALLTTTGHRSEEHPDGEVGPAILFPAPELPGSSADSMPVYPSTFRTEPVEDPDESSTEGIWKSGVLHGEEGSISYLRASGTDGGDLSHFPLDTGRGM